MSELQSLTAIKPSLPEKVFVGIGRAVENRYEKHRQRIVDNIIIPHLVGKPREIQDKLMPRLELAAKAAAVTATTAEIVGGVIAVVGTEIFFQKGIGKSGIVAPSFLAADQEWFHRVDWDAAVKVGDSMKRHPAFSNGYHLSSKMMGEFARELEIQLSHLHLHL